MEETAIKTSVNVTLGHEDMVEMMLQEAIEQRETLLSELSKKSGNISIVYAELKKELEEVLIDSNGIRSTKSYKKFAKGIAALGIKADALATVGYTNEDIGFVIKWPLNNFEGYKSPMSQLKKRIREYESTGKLKGNNSYHHKPEHTIYTIDTPNVINVNLSATSEDKSITLKVKGGNIEQLKINAKAKKLIKQMGKAIEDKMNISQEIADLEMELFAFEHDTKRTKTKFVKGMLTNSKNGKELVTLMEGIQGNNLLNLGTKK
jgi:hypothetical protein